VSISVRFPRCSSRKASTRIRGGDGRCAEALRLLRGRAPETIERQIELTVAERRHDRRSDLLAIECWRSSFVDVDFASRCRHRSLPISAGLTLPPALLTIWCVRRCTGRAGISAQETPPSRSRRIRGRRNPVRFDQIDSAAFRMPLAKSNSIFAPVPMGSACCPEISGLTSRQEAPDSASGLLPASCA
jgi:hypothetical protein